ncbi:hypothetical protein Ahy_B04g069764 isoform C [Arachis hypogaea]|uniref:Uncharacterized protein n=1 Tax=Arachis hypogaea TaxID=3818 RepID=A0A444ZDJ4_ARAHY|nr:hypothetical protein Ahy_B04g069764 isoform C [Arachis hypogaea]
MSDHYTRVESKLNLPDPNSSASSNSPASRTASYEDKNGVVVPLCEAAEMTDGDDYGIRWDYVQMWEDLIPKAIEGGIDVIGTYI